MNLIKFRPDNGSVARTEFNNLSDIFDAFFGDSFLLVMEPVYRPLVNVRETSSDYQLEMSVPGYSKNDIQLTVEDQVLTIRGSHQEASDEKTIFHRKEFNLSEFCRSFELSDDIDIEKIHAQHEKGVLQVILPKKPEAVKRPPREIHIN